MEKTFTGYIIREDYDLNNLEQYGFYKTEPARINPWWQCPFNIVWNVFGIWDCELLVDNRDRKLLMWSKEGSNLDRLNKTIEDMKKMGCCIMSKMWKNKFFQDGELKDNDIVVALKSAIDNYEDGAILEARDLLKEIVYAIDEFVCVYNI